MTSTFLLEKAHEGLVTKGTMFKVLRYLDQTAPELPVLILDKEKVREKASIIGKGIPGAKVFYAVKANPAPEVIEFVNELGLGFEIASEGELALLERLDVAPERIISSNPMKTYKFLRMAGKYGLDLFSYDSEAEVDKIAEHIPGARVYVRLSVPNEGSEWPLSKKFGVEPDTALPLLRYARDKGLRPVGITFHVGSQCLNKFSWDSAVYKARAVWETARQEGIGLCLLNIGGGYPIRYTKRVVGIEEIEENLARLLAEHFPGVEIHIEPGRAVVGDAGVFVSTVNGTAMRGEERWLYIDVGVFNGLMESVGGIKYGYVVEDTGGEQPRRRYVVSGPSCDSFDVIAHEVELPEPRPGSLILILSAGAYTVSYASEFNGFAIPKTKLV